MLDRERNADWNELGRPVDPGVSCRFYEALALWCLGYPDQSRERARDAGQAMKRLTQPHHRCSALGLAALLHVHGREPEQARELADAVVRLAREYGFPFYVAYGTILGGHALVELGRTKEGLSLLRRGMAAYRASETGLGVNLVLSLLADASLKNGAIEEAANALADARDGPDIYEAEVHRARGELALARLGKRPVPARTRTKRTFRHVTPRERELAREAEAFFLEAIACARRQSARAFELRAAIGLSRLWSNEGRRREARTLLSEIYGWFTEGFDTRDVREARTLLDELR